MRGLPFGIPSFNGADVPRNLMILDGILASRLRLLEILGGYAFDGHHPRPRNLHKYYITPHNRVLTCGSKPFAIP